MPGILKCQLTISYSTQLKMFDLHKQDDPGELTEFVLKCECQRFEIDQILHYCQVNLLIIGHQ